ncbi:hypothetical protein AAG906_004980 [Vitis piasezkii]
MQKMSIRVVRSLGVRRFLEWGVVNARGVAGGVVVFWDNRVLELVGMEVCQFSISCCFKNCEDGFMWIFTGGGLFTWSGALNSQSMCRLDRFLVSEDWESHFRGQEKSRELSMEEVEARKEAKEDFKKWVLMEEVSWRQKSREIWLRGDRNEGYFHRMANAHKRRNWLREIKINGMWYVARLEEPFSEEEISSALFELNGDKASGPDGFTIAFWQFS